MTVIERFLNYVSYPTPSDENCENCPSTKSQLLLAEEIRKDMESIGMEDAKVDENGYVSAFLSASDDMSDLPPLGLIAHMDTSPDAKGTDIKPAVIDCDGKDIKLASGNHITAKEFPVIEKYKNQKLIVTDGTTLLGADDKAGISEIISACERIIKNKESHRAIAVCITPDEEIGRGADLFPLKSFKAPVAYTVDGGEIGEIEYENFNAAAAKIYIHGKNIHPGEAKNKMKNAALYASEFVSLLPPAEAPAHTEGYEGFYHVQKISADETEGYIQMLIRDHDIEKYEERKQFIKNLCEYLNSVYGEKTFEHNITDTYFNMKEKILPHIELIDNAKRAMESAGITPKIVAIRGGTDGARLSYEGLPCPNLSTGGVNFHSVREFIPVNSLEKMVDVIVNLTKLA